MVEYFIENDHKEIRDEVMNTKIDIISGFLGAGKTTFLKKLLNEAYPGESVALLENEFGEVAIDGDLLKDSNFVLKEISNGCICCTLQGNFISAIHELQETHHPQRIVIEPTGLGRLSDIFRACNRAAENCPVVLNAAITVVDGTSALEYLDDAPEFYENQIAQTGAVVVSMTQRVSKKEVAAIEERIRHLNANAPIFTRDWRELDAMEVLVLAETKGCAEDPKPTTTEKNPFRSLAFRVTRPWKERDLKEFFHRMIAGDFGKIYRGKGFFPAGKRMLKVDLVGRRVDVTDFPQKTRGRFVLIGKDMNAKALSSFLHHGKIEQKESPNVP